MKIGICGGTFDPFHRGHIEPILAVRAEMQWDRIVYMPAFVQPFKRDRRAESGFHRFAMAALATEDLDDVFVSPLELERGAVSYTVDTLQQLREEDATSTFDWIVGDDNLDALHAWKSIDTIFELANFTVLSRGGRNVPEAMRLRVRAPRERASHGAIVIAENAAVPVSSTEIRKRIRDGESIDGLVDPRVSRYIDHYGLYRKGQT